MEKEETIRYGKLIFSILNDYLNGKKVDRDIKNEDLPVIINIAKDNSILLVTYLALKNEGISLPKKVEDKLSQLLSMNLRKTILFEEERKSLYAYMDEKKIAYLPLKGIIINELYKEYGSREFADNDILFDLKYKKDIKEYFLSKGYEIEQYNEWIHDVYQKKPFFNFEMHKYLFADSRRDETIKKFEKYFENYLSKGKKKDDSYERIVSKEDFFIYFMAHFYKHYAHDGCGIRSLLDIKIYLDKNPDISWEYLNEEFKKIGINSFVNEIVSTTNHLFSSEELNEKENGILLYMISNGTYGTLEAGVSNSLKEEGKMKYIFRRLFPPMTFYKVNYPKIYKTKVLIPIIWFKRLFKALTKSRKKIKKELQLVKESDTSNNKKD